MNTETTCVEKQPLTDAYLEKMNAYWRAANYLSAAQLYLLDEPIAGVDPAARDFILRTILTNYNEEGTVLISTHLIADIEKVLDEVILLKDGALMLHESVDHIREERGKSVDALFREIFRAMPMEGGEF